MNLNIMNLDQDSYQGGIELIVSYMPSLLPSQRLQVPIQEYWTAQKL